jgi:hypothetical protein
MQKTDIAEFIDFLLQRTNDGYTVLTFNGLGFDFDVLAEESGRLDDCRRIALSHVDIMFHVFCAKGFPVGLDASARAFGCGKSAGVDGALAPQLWRDGKHQQVLEYVAQDCRITLDVALRSENSRSFLWINKKGATSSLDLGRGWLTVKEAMPSHSRTRVGWTIHCSGRNLQDGSGEPAHDLAPCLACLPGASCEIVLIQCLPHQRFNDCLTADIQVLGSEVKFLQHRGSKVNIHSLNWLYHATLTLEEPRYALPLVGRASDVFRRNWISGLTSFLHTVEFLPLLISTA